MSKEFKAIYRILKTLMKWQGNEAFSNELISAQAVGLSFEKWEQIMIELSNNGYVEGVVYTQTMSDRFPHIVDSGTPRITLKGMEYVEGNGLMQKTAEALKLLGEIIP